MDDHDSAETIECAWRDGLKPDPLLTVSEWADRYRVLSQRASFEPGRWRTERTPYLKEIMDCLSPASPVQRVALMKGAQIGGTECGNCWIGYVIHQAPGPMMAVAPPVALLWELLISAQATGPPIRRQTAHPSEERMAATYLAGPRRHPDQDHS
jgi:phage terminase large subunit GpA-like protein